MIETFLKTPGNALGRIDAETYLVAAFPGESVTVAAKDLTEYLANKMDVVTDTYLMSRGLRREDGYRSIVHVKSGARLFGETRSELEREALRAFIFLLLGWTQTDHTWTDRDGVTRYWWVLHLNARTSAKSTLQEIIECK